MATTLIERTAGAVPAPDQRRRGPGTRSKNPYKFDHNGQGQEALGNGNKGKLKKTRKRLDARTKAWEATRKADYAKSAKGQRKPGSMKA
jgi:hypothetical protein